MSLDTDKKSSHSLPRASVPAQDAAPNNNPRPPQPSTSVFAGAMINMGGEILAAIGPLFYAVVSRLMGADILGTYLLATTYVTLFFRLAVVGMDKGMLRHIPMAKAAGNAEVSSVLGTALRWVTVLSLIFTFVGFLFPELLLFRESQETVQNTAWWVAVLMLSLPFQALNNTMMFAVRGLSVMWVYVVVRNVVGPLSLIALSLVPLALGYGAGSLAFGYVVSAALTFLVGYIFFRHHFRQPLGQIFSSKKDKDLVSFAVPQGVTNLLNLLLGRVDILMIAAFYPKRPELIAFYGVASTIAVVVRKIRVSFDHSVSPELAKALAAGDDAALKSLFQRTGRWIFALFMLAAGVVMLGSRPILALFGSQYIQYWPVLVILVSGRLLNSLAGPAQSALLMAGRSRLELLNSAAVNAVNVALNLLLIPRYHIIGAAMATASAITLFNAVRMVQCGVILKIWADARGVVKVLAATAISSLPALATMFSCPTSLSAAGAGVLLFVVTYVAVSTLLLGQQELLTALSALRKTSRKKDEKKEPNA